MIYLLFLKKRLVWTKERTGKKPFLNVSLCFLFDGCWSHFFLDSAQPRPLPAPGAQREQLQTGLPSDLIQVSAATHTAFATSVKPQVSILAHADWSSGTSLVSGAATGLASITTKHNHTYKINLPSYRFWNYEIKCKLQYVFLQEIVFDIRSYVLDRSSPLKSKLAWW